MLEFIQEMDCREILIVLLWIGLAAIVVGILIMYRDPPPL